VADRNNDPQMTSFIEHEFLGEQVKLIVLGIHINFWCLKKWEKSCFNNVRDSYFW